MRKCPKCGLTYADSSKICRACGAILDEVDDPIPAADPADDFAVPAPDDDSFEEALRPTIAAAVERLPAAGPLDDWVCGECGERVPAKFQICWNCEAAAVVSSSESDSPATRRADIDGDQRARRENPASTLVSTETPKKRKCPACGSTQMISSVSVVNHEGYGIKVVVEGNPEAFIFKDRRDGPLLADICGECGNVQLRVKNPIALYEHYVQSQDSPE